MLSPGWRCTTHGPVLPAKMSSSLTEQWVRNVANLSDVPLWLPWPLPAGWMVTGAVSVGDEKSAGPACALLCSGPGARAGPAELALIAEEPGVGLGAGYAGLPGPDVGTGPLEGAPTTRVVAGQHDVPLWEVALPTGQPDRSVYVGEAEGCWLWAVAWPMEAGLVLHDSVRLVDMRDPGHVLDFPLGAVSPRWRPGQ